MKLKNILILGGAILLLFPTHFILNNSTNLSHDSTWLKYDTPEDAGWSSSKLREAKKYYKSLDSMTAMVIYDGKVLLEWGDLTKNTSVHSVRKSLLNALYGIHVKEGSVTLDRTLESLGIDDKPKLTETERRARISDLLTSRSGVFHKSGEETWRMKITRPRRESYPPGTYFYYNNWDFNVLGTIFNQKTESDLFIEFQERIATPLGMDDFTLEQTNYKFDKKKSIHPSYLFKMSARDMAKFGQLYLQNGKWEDQQIIPEDWIAESTSIHSNVPKNPTYGYGYLWWVAKSGRLKDLGLFSAVGKHGQSIDIVPKEKLVFVHKVNTDHTHFRRSMKNVNQSKRLKLLKMILDAKIPEPKLNPL